MELFIPYHRQVIITMRRCWRSLEEGQNICSLKTSCVPSFLICFDRWRRRLEFVLIIETFVINWWKAKKPPIRSPHIHWKFLIFGRKSSENSLKKTFKKTFKKKVAGSYRVSFLLLVLLLLLLFSIPVFQLPGAKNTDGPLVLNVKRQQQQKRKGKKQLLLAANE